MVNLTGGYGDGLRETVKRYDARHKDRFYTFAEPTYEKFLDPGYPRLQAEAIGQAHQGWSARAEDPEDAGALPAERYYKGQLVKIDDPRFDPMWDACGQLGMPVAIHVSDPVAFFRPTDRFNERYEELKNHPDWSFHGGDFPSNAELLEARNRVFARHPKTHFIVLHVGNFAENLAQRVGGDGSLSEYDSGHCCADRRVWPAASDARERSSTSTRTGCCLGRMRRRMATSIRSRCLRTSCTRFITGFWRRRTSTSTMRRRGFRLRGDGGSTALVCRIRSAAEDL